MSPKELDKERMRRKAAKKQEKAGNTPTLRERQIFAKFRKAVCCGTCGNFRKAVCCGTCGNFRKCTMAVVYNVCDLWEESK